MTEVSEELFDEEEDSLLDALASTPDGAVLPRKTVIDAQYQIERVLGQGGMGVVYLARDQKLDRDVAIKVGIERSAAALGKLAREALVLARLSHPNVVVIYQVGEIGDRAYVAMEYVPDTARAWCVGKSSREVLALYIAAGAGLEAAHANGLVHCDFKPDNVLVGADGRPRVADFGLARTADGEGQTLVAGTPAYMAPEQGEGGGLDARADQYAFCASLWEALFGVRAPERSPRKVPAHVEAALRRGMEKARTQRWPSMTPLLAELRRDPGRRAWIAGAAIAIAGIGAAAALFARGASNEDVCGSGERVLASTWSSARAEQVRAAIAPTGAPPWLVLTAGRTVDEIDRWAGRWTAQHRAVCEASRGGWSPALADRGAECLAQSQRDLATTVELVLASPKLAARADQIIEKLGGPERCADAAYVGASVAPPENAVQAARVRAERAELARIEALVDGGQPRQARAMATAAIARVRVLEYAPLFARVDQQLAQTAMRLGEYDAALASFREGYYAARTGRDPEAAAQCAAGSALALLDLSRDGEAAEWAHLAEVEATTSADPASEIAALSAMTVIEKARNEPERALADAERFVVLARTRGVAQIDALRARSGALDLLGKHEAALADLDEALRRQSERYTKHPTISDIERERSLVLQHLHRFDAAVDAARASVAMAETTRGPNSLEANNALAALGGTLKDAQRFPEAREVLEQSLALTRKIDGPRSYNAASDMNNLADLLQLLEKYDEAFAVWTEARAIFVEVVGPDGSEVGMVDGNVANAYIGAGRLADAHDAAKSAVALTSKSPDSPMHAQALIALGMAQFERGDAVHAKESLATGVAKLDDDPRWRYRARFYLAKLELAEGHTAKARELATGALADARVSNAPETVAAIEQLLAQLPRR